jgi:hypothetical protein
MCCCNKSENKVKDPVCGMIIDLEKLAQPVSEENQIASFAWSNASGSSLARPISIFRTGNHL